MSFNKNIVQQGRSMIEMLGVLAIIGVLSVGGIAGYSKAMERYRINETINQISHIVQNTHTLFYSQKDYSALDEEYDLRHTNNPNRLIVEKAKILPESIIKKGYLNLFGGSINYGSHQQNGRFSKGDKKAFVFAFRDIPQEACVELAVQNWQNIDGFIAFSISQNSSAKAWVYGLCETDVANKLFCASEMPVTPEQAVNACVGESNNLWWRFY